MEGWERLTIAAALWLFPHRLAAHYVTSTGCPLFGGTSTSGHWLLHDLDADRCGQDNGFLLSMHGQLSKLDSSCLHAVSQKWIGFATRMGKRHDWRMLESVPEAI